MADILPKLIGSPGRLKIKRLAGNRGVFFNSCLMLLTDKIFIKSS